MLSSWKRPETTPYPRVYSRFKGKKPMPDGRIPDFWVQDATPEHYAEVMEIMMFFVRDEPMSKTMKVQEFSPEMMEMGMALMTNLLQKQLTVVALTDWPDGKPCVVGANILYHFRKGDEKNMPEITIEGMRKGMHVMFLTLGMVDVYEKYGVEEFTTAMGLSVHPDFRGQNLGTEILKARVEMTKAVGLRLTLNNFTGPASQKQAERAGYELLAEVPYSEIREENGDEMFPGIEAKTLQFRVKYCGDDK